MVTIKTNYEPLDHFLVRKPLLPVERYPSSTASNQQHSADQTCKELAQLQSTLLDPKARVALLLGSLSLYRAAQDPGRRTHGFKDIVRKLLRYVIRMTSRSTPYGAFASVGIGEWGYRTDLSVGVSIVTRSRPDMGWLCQYISILESRQDFRATLRVKASPLLFARANRFYLEKQYGPDSRLQSSALSIRADGIVKFIVDESSTYIEWNILKCRAIAYAGRPSEFDKIEELMSELLSSGVLTSDLCPSLGLASQGLELSTRLNRADLITSGMPRIRNLIDRFTRWDLLPWAERESELLALFSAATDMLPEATSTPIQVDCGMELDGAILSLEVGQEVAKAAELLLRLSRRQPGYGYLASYRRKFEERYGSERLVPLQEVLDPEWGLGPPLFDEIAIGPSVNWIRRDEVLLGLVAIALRQGESQVELNDELLSELAAKVDCGSLPSSIELYVMIAARSREDIDTGDFKVVVGPNVGTHMAGKTVARFADFLGKQAEALMTNGVAAHCTGRENAVCAELTYRPGDDRLMNVMLRPIAAEYEIPIGVTPSLPAERVIEFSDLLIGLKNDQFFLHSDILKRDVIVSCQHMLNSIAAPLPVRFLSDLSLDGKTQLSAFDWGAARKQPFLPRVSCGRVVLSVAEWKLFPQDFAVGPLDFDSRFDKFRRLWNVPRFIYVAVEDNRLLLDLDDRSHLEILREELKSVGTGNHLTLQEVVPAFDECWLLGEEGTYISELVIPLRRKHSAEKPTFDTLANRVWDPRCAQQHRVRAPGSDWLYLKANIDSRIEEILLMSELAEFALATKLRFGEIAMFFVRYAEDGRQLRIRWNGPAQLLWAAFFETVCVWAGSLLQKGLFQRFAFDTYLREIERYGGSEAMRIAEAVFAVDSVVVLELLRKLDRKGEVEKTIVAVVSLSKMLAALGMSVQEQAQWCNRKVRRTPDVGTKYRSLKLELLEAFKHCGALEPSVYYMEAFKRGSFENSVGNAAQRACALNAAKLSFPAMRNKTVRMVSKRAYPRALRFAA